VRIASNIGPTGGGFEYTLFQELLVGCDFSAQRVAWGAKLNGSPRDLLNAQKQTAEAKAAGSLRVAQFKITAGVGLLPTPVQVIS